MFKIARTNSLSSGVHGLPHQEMLAQFCVSEGWSGDLTTGLFILGDKAAAIHGLRDNECGLRNFVRCYDPPDRNHVLELFEQAATSCSTFCFSTTVVLETGQKQPLFCIGESSGLEERYSGSMAGVFFFPRFVVEGAQVVLRQ
ncbi:hypothetical protein QN219_01245 [Sinorhizobium sp. 7-81]|uniref:hypothetical protein n=1 Tax=Sinorhizobium sp. 8-89 TaxID=3049089 RepID=UPI0024C29E6E|nr:hypothetical protein [Sinorhizobium sp. 8-89]MDK1488685.1 hypothetical protein [Sinorhizobium sp. 8-89]